MASKLPRDYVDIITMPADGAPVHRVAVQLPQFTANSTVTRAVLPFDRKAVIREIWFVAEAVPSDADGTMLINVHARDKSEAAFDSLVASFDCEAQLTVANEAKRATLVAETSENEWTVEAGDALRVQLVSNSAAIDTNINPVILVVYQVIAPVTA